MIVGLGVDIAEVGRIEAAIVRHGRPFLQRVFISRAMGSVCSTFHCNVLCSFLSVSRAQGIISGHRTVAL